MKYKGLCRTNGIEFPVTFEIDRGEVKEFEPDELKDKLTGDALIAHVNYQNLLKGALHQLPTRIKDVYRAPGEIDVPTDIALPTEK